MEPEVEATLPRFRSGSRSDVFGFGISQIHSQQRSEIGGSSFTALLQLPPPQAVELLVNEDSPAPFFPSNVALIDRASRFSVFASATNLPESKLTFTGSSSMKLDVVKRGPLDSDSRPNSSSSAVSHQSPKLLKRKETEKKVGEPNKKSKQVVANETTEDTREKLPYVHVRTRRGQATDSHSLVERARREKINARMKLLQDLVPGCNKISGTAMVLDEIINHVQALQRQVEFLSMKLAAVNPRSEFNFDALLAKQSEPAVESRYYCMFTPEGQVCGGRQQSYRQTWHFNGLLQPAWGREDHHSNFITPDNSLLSFDSSPISVSLHSSQLKMEL